MLPLAADENFNFDIVRGLRRRNPLIDIVTIQEAGLSGVNDPGVLEWWNGNGRLVFTHDVATMTKYAYDRVRNGQGMPGVFEVSSELPLSGVIDDMALIAECSDPDEWQGQVRYLPL